MGKVRREGEGGEGGRGRRARFIFGYRVGCFALSGWLEYNNDF